MRRPRIRTLLLASNLVVIVLPFLGIRALRLYENELTRQTQAALLAEGVYIREHYLASLIEAVAADRDAPAFWAGYGRALPPAGAGDPAAEPFDPLLADVDLTQEAVRPRAPEAEAASLAAHPFAVAAGTRMGDLLRRSQRYTLSGIRVVDPHGIVVATSRGELGQSLAGREEVARALAGDPVRLLRVRVSDEPPPPLEALSRGNRVRLFVALPIVHESRVVGAVVLSRTPVELARALYKDRLVLLQYGGGLILLCVAVSVLSAVTISRPIAALIRQADEVKKGGVARPLSRPGSREVERLSQAVAQMADTLRSRAASIETFARNVSHELKTPLATVRATVELLREHLDSMTLDERERFLSMLDGESARMQRMVERLLLLARAEVAPTPVESVEPGPVLTDVAQRFVRLGTRVELSLDAAVAAARVRIAREGLESVLSNLLENSRQHGGNDVRIAVRARIDGALDRARLEVVVEDSGPGISPANRARVFEAFFTTARDQGGTGLGLPIVRALLEAHDGSIDLLPAEGGHGLRAVVRLPVAGLAT
jgi:signal transduction histidine kinase